MLFYNSPKSSFICWNFSAYHCLYDLPEIHQSYIFSAISFSCSSVKRSEEELDENPPCEIPYTSVSSPSCRWSASIVCRCGMSA